MGKKVELKTQKNDASVKDFIASIKDPGRRADCEVVDSIMEKISGEKGAMWGASIVGYGSYDYKYASGREGTWMRLGFSPRVQKLTIYIMPGYQDFGDLMKDLGPHKTGKSCLYIKRLSDIHLPTLKKIIKKGWDDMKKKYS